MQKYLIILILSLITSCASRAIEVNRQYNPNWARRIAVLDFKAKDTNFGGMVSNIFAKHLLMIGYNVVERQELQRILAEQKLNLSGVIAYDQIKQVGRLSGVDALLMGNALEGAKKLKKEVSITGKLIDAQTGEVIWVGAGTKQAENTQEAIEHAVSAIAGKVSRYIKTAPRPRVALKPEKKQDTTPGQPGRLKEEKSTPEPPKPADSTPESESGAQKQYQNAQKKQESAQEAGPKSTPEKPYKLNKSAIKILEIMRGNPKVRIKDIVPLIGIKARAIKKNIKKLKGLGLLKRVGPDKGGHWEVIE